MAHELDVFGNIRPVGTRNALDGERGAHFGRRDAGPQDTAQASANASEFAALEDLHRVLVARPDLDLAQLDRPRSERGGTVVLAGWTGIGVLAAQRERRRAEFPWRASPYWAK